MNVMLPMLEALHTLPRVMIDHLPLLLMLAGIMHLCVATGRRRDDVCLDWRRNLSAVSGSTRHIIWTHGGFVLATIVGFGMVSLLQPTTLALAAPLARAVCASSHCSGPRLAIGFTVFSMPNRS